MTLEELAALARSARLPTDPKQLVLATSYFASYAANVGHFADNRVLNESDALIAACMSYAWLPRAVRINPSALPEAVSAMNAAREGTLTLEVIAAYARLVEGSVIAASKALHFAAPAVVPIYDRKVHAAFFGTRISSSKEKRFEPFLAYAQQLRSLAASPAFPAEVRVPLVAALGPLCGAGAQPNTWSALSDIRVAELCLFYSPSSTTEHAP